MNDCALQPLSLKSISVLSASRGGVRREEEMPEVWKRLYFSTLRESRGCETGMWDEALGYARISVLSASRGGVRHRARGEATVARRAISVLSASRGGVRHGARAPLPPAAAHFSTLRESRGCETCNASRHVVKGRVISVLSASRGGVRHLALRYRYANDTQFQYSPRVEGV